MVTKIKRIAQFLFDNAELIEQYLRQSDNYRSAEIDLRVFKQNRDASELEIILTLYDGTFGLHELQDDAIYKEKFIRLCQMINEGSGVVELPKPVKVRDKLEN